PRCWPEIPRPVSRLGERALARSLDLSSAAVDQLDPVAVRIAHEAKERAAFAHAIRLALRLDPLLAQAREGRGEVVDRESDVPVPRSELVGVDPEVVRQFEPILVAGQAHEDVDRLVADRQPPALLEAERGVERDRTVDIADAVAGVDQVGHHGIVSAGSSSKSRSRPARTSKTPNASW